MTLFAVLMSPCVAAYAAVIPENISPSSIVTEDFDVSVITDLAYPVCTWNLGDNKKENFYHFVEGEMCPAGGERCTYSGVMKLNGKIAILKQLSSDNGTSVFKNDNTTIITTLTPIKNPKAEVGSEEESDFNAVVVIKTSRGEKKLEMTGFCSI